jgi:cytochrome-b5 reductase
MIANTTVKVARRVLSLSRQLCAASDAEYASSCFFPTDWLEVPLVNRLSYSHDSDLFEFGLPEGRSLDLPVCACILAKGPKDAKGEDVVRPYTPISDNSMKGKFQLLVKVRFVCIMHSHTLIRAAC